MSSDEVQALQRDFNDLRDEVRGWGRKMDVIHNAVLGMAGKTYVPGPSFGRRLAALFQRSPGGRVPDQEHQDDPGETPSLTSG